MIDTIDTDTPLNRDSEEEVPVPVRVQQCRRSFLAVAFLLLAAVCCSVFVVVVVGLGRTHNTARSSKQYYVQYVSPTLFCSPRGPQIFGDFW